MQLLVARAKLLLSLRSVVQAQRQDQVPPSPPAQPLRSALTCTHLHASEVIQAV